MFVFVTSLSSLSPIRWSRPWTTTMLYFQERTGGRTVDRRLNIRFLINKIFLILVIFDVIMTSFYHDILSPSSWSLLPWSQQQWQWQSLRRLLIFVIMLFFNSNCSGGSPHEGKRRELNRERDLVPQKRWQCHPRYDRNHHHDIHQNVRHDRHQCDLMVIIIL